MEVLVDLIVGFVKLFRIAFIVQPWEQAYRVRLGRWDKVYGRGMHFRIPFGVDLVKEWDKRTLVADLQSQSIRTKDKKSLAVSGVLRYKISDVRLASTKVRDLRKGLKNTASAMLAKVVNNLNNDQITIAMLEVNVVKALEGVAKGWGASIITFQDVLRHMSETKEIPESAVLDLS
jgi:regulator of protease activity HflC (stomatin/prohibitin superfamily)